MQRILRVLSLTVLLMLPTTSALAAIAYVHALQGTLSGQYGNGAPRALKIGDLLDSGVTLSTGEKSSATVKFEDGQVVVMQADTRFAVRDYRYNLKQPKDSNVLFQLVKGGLRFVTGMIGSTNPDSFKLNVGTATIGVRGTDAYAYYNDITNEITAAVNAGALALSSDAGPPVIIPTGNFSSLTDNQPPTPPLPIAQASAVIQAQLNQVRASLVPINTPVVVQAAAQAAVAQEAARVAAQAAAAAPNNQALQQAAALAQQAAAAALQAAIQAATSAFQAAINAGFVPPAPPVSPTVQPQPPAPPAPPAPTPTPTTTTPGGGSVASPS